MTPVAPGVAERLPPLRLPRALLDPRCPRLGPADAEGLVTVTIERTGGRLTALEPWTPAAGRSSGPSPQSPAGAAFPLAITPPVEPHAHLDKAFSGAAFPNPDGTMAGALAANRREGEARSGEQVLARGERALELAWRQGLRAVRSHVDSLGAAAWPSWEALLQLRERWADRVELQLVALVPVAHWRSAAGESLARRVAAAGGLLGGVLGAPFAAGADDRESLLALMRLAEQFACGIDLHVDESDRNPGRGVRMVADLRLAHRFTAPCACSHASSMALLPDRACRRLAERLAAAAVDVVALPATNFWLLARRGGTTPWRRPQAPIRQLQEAGVCVAVGGDNVQDPWFPGGAFDPIDRMRFCLAASQLAPWRRSGLSPQLTEGARLMGLAWDGVLRVGGPADLVVLAASSWSDLLAAPPRRRVLRGDLWLPPPPAELPSPLLRGLGRRRR